MTGQEIMYVVGFFVMISGALWGVWWRVEGKMDRSKAEALMAATAAQHAADMVAKDLADHRLHVATHYSTKSGMKEIKDEILGAVSGIRDDVRHLATRIDSMHEAQVKPRPRRAAGE